MAAKVQVGQPSSRPCTSGYSTSSRPTVRIPTPTGSSRSARGAFDSRTSTAAATRVATPMGRLIRKIDRHPSPSGSLWSSRPATGGPATFAMPPTAPYRPKAAARSLTGKLAWMMDRIWGIIVAAMAPCRTRDATSSSGLWAAAHGPEATVKPATPIRNRRLRPRMSPRRPAVISTSANARV